VETIIVIMGVPVVISSSRMDRINTTATAPRRKIASVTWLMRVPTVNMRLVRFAPRTRTTMAITFVSTEAPVNPNRKFLDN
jgi:hypothetical protein